MGMREIMVKYSGRRQRPKSTKVSYSFFYFFFFLELHRHSFYSKNSFYMNAKMYYCILYDGELIFSFKINRNRTMYNN